MGQFDASGGQTLEKVIILDKSHEKKSDAKAETPVLWPPHAKS